MNKHVTAHITKRMALLALSLFCFLSSQAQNKEFTKDNFPGRKEELKEAQKRLASGEEFFAFGKKELIEFRKRFFNLWKYYPVSFYDYQKAGYQDFRLALSPLSDANRFNPNNAKVNYMLGLIWFMTDPISKESLEFFVKAYALNPRVEDDLPFWLGWSCHLNSKWDEAITYYEEYHSFLKQRAKTNAAPIEDVKKKIYECQNGKTFNAKPERVFVDNLGPNINTQYPEYGPSISTDESTIIFTARRPNSTGGKRDPTDNGFHEDVYVSQKEKGKWQASKQLSKNVNTDNHDAAAGLSPDGNKLYVYRHVERDGGDLYESVLFGMDWEPPVHMNKNINTKFHESSVSLTFDGKRMYFVSDKDGGYGDRDIYYSEIDINGEWGVSKNIGPEINTKYAEEAVFVHPDGVTMYFSSKGHNAMGGYDIFRTRLVGGKWQKPENMGYPINGPDDDVFFVVSGSGNRAYFASAKAGGYGDKDIYKITFLGAEKAPILNTQDQLISVVANPVNNFKAEALLEVKSSKLTLLKGVVSDAQSGKPLGSSIDLINNEKDQVLATFKSNSSTGKYLVTLPSGGNYGIAVRQEGYMFHSENFNIPDTLSFQEFVLDVKLKKIEVGNSVVLKNIFFDFDQSNIKAESINELNRLVKLLKDNPKVKVEISSHTDDIGSEDYNQKLSESRCKSVIDYIISKGITANRVIAKGYGETKPIAKNDTEEGRQNNRRTEFKILEK
jgi:outer membrane protein OmpA-like peptidoglycan-associated protein/tetratricopeptide (TPR) repeat protein